MLMCSISFKWTKQFLLAWVLLFLLSHQSTKGQMNDRGDLEDWKTSWRLPSAFKPSKYRLRLEPRIDQSDFLGKVTVYFTSTSPRNSIVLHSKYLNITNIALFSTGPAYQIQMDPYLGSARQQVDVSEWFLYEEYEFLVVKLKEDLEPELEYALEIHYQGSFLNGRLNAFYTSAYNFQGNKKIMATTKFEPNFARWTFPCFDEPDLKAIFFLEVFTKTSENVFSNMPVLKEVYDDYRGKYLVQFDRTPIMSTYTFCWIVSDFQVVEEFMTSSGVLVRGLARRGHEGFLRYATDITKKSVEFHENWLGVAYHLPKLDIIGIPDFQAGAMENWGLVTFKETYIIINPKTSGYMDYSTVSNVICHEIAHMWFGNLVTMKWWNDIWLNEGFATFFSMKCNEAVEPELKVDELIYITKKLPALEVDSVVNIHPLVNNLTHNDQFTGAFDDIAYKKGHAILEMVEDTMGYEAFQQGISLYVNRYVLGNAKTEDLIAALNEVSKVDISYLLEDWTKKPGYPVVTVKKKDNLLYLTQSRFVDKDKLTAEDAASCQWKIPINYRTADEPHVKRLYLSKQNRRAVIKLKSSSSWFKLNHHHIGFYRVNYPDSVWLAFEQHLINFDLVVSHWSDRANLLDDACSLANAGHVKFSVILPLFSYLGKGKETHYAPWKVASKCLSGIKGGLPSTDNTSDMFSEYVRNLINPLLPETLASINKKKSSPFDFDLASEVIFSLACSFKHPDAVSKAKDLLNLWFKDKSAVNLDIVATVFKCGMAGEDEELRWNRLWALYKKARDPYELRDLAIGLTSVDSTTILEKFLGLARDENLVRGQDYYAILANYAKKKKTNSMVWDLFESEFIHFEKKFTLGKIGQLFQIVASNFDTKEELEKVKKFVRKHPCVVPHNDDQNRVIEIILDNIKWSEKYKDNIKYWLESTSQQPATD